MDGVVVCEAKQEKRKNKICTLLMLWEDGIISPKHYFILRHAGQLGHVGSFIQVVNSNITKFMLLFSNNRRLEYVIEIPSGLQYKRIRRLYGRETKVACGFLWCDGAGL